MLAVATIMGIRADQFGKQADALANILSSYGMMHAAEGTQGKGVYVITESSYIGSMGPSGGSETNDFYDVSSKKYIGGTYERY